MVGSGKDVRGVKVDVVVERESAVGSSVAAADSTGASGCGTVAWSSFLAVDVAMFRTIGEDRHDLDIEAVAATRLLDASHR